MIIAGYLLPIVVDTIALGVANLTVQTRVEHDKSTEGKQAVEESGSGGYIEGGRGVAEDGRKKMRLLLG